MDTEDKSQKFNTLLQKALIEKGINVIEDENLERGVEIGRGAFGKVYKGVYKGEHEVAIKKLLFDINDKEFKENELNAKVVEIMNEIEVVECLRHENIPVFYGIWRRKSKKNPGKTTLNLVFEFVDGPMLVDYYKNASFNDKVEILIQLVTILEFMHSKKLIHRDIKPGNVIIRKKDNTAKLIDFGTSKMAKNTATNTATAAGTVSYMPPEAFSVELSKQGEEREDGKILEITPKYDIWSMGCMISEIFSGVLPWTNKFKGQFGIQNQLIKKAEFPLPKNIQPEVVPTIKGCLEVDVNKRFNATQLLESLRSIKKK